MLNTNCKADCKKWVLPEALALCLEVESIAPKYGYHVALTGGVLYKPGSRKDLDLIFYRIRQVEFPDSEGLFEALDKIGLTKVGGFGWCHKFTYEGFKDVDLLFPEEVRGDYVS